MSARCTRPDGRDEDLVEVLSVVSLSAYMDILSLSLRIGQQATPGAPAEPGGKMMALIDYPDLDRIDAENREAIDRFAREHGRPTLLRMMLAYSPPAQEAMNDLYHPVVQNGQALPPPQGVPPGRGERRAGVPVLRRRAFPVPGQRVRLRPGRRPADAVRRRSMTAGPPPRPPWSRVVRAAASDPQSVTPGGHRRRCATSAGPTTRSSRR